METAKIDEKAVLRAVSGGWRTAQEVVARLGAPASARRKVATILSVLVSVAKVKTRTRNAGKQGRPPAEYRRI